MRKPFGWVALSLLLVLGLSACQDGGGSRRAAASPGASAAASQNATPDAAVTFSPASGATGVRPDEQIVVSAVGGTLASVNVRSARGGQLAGQLDAAAGVWRSGGILATGTGYTVTAVAANEDGKRTTETSTFTTLRPSSTAGAIMVPGDDWEVGVGMPIVVQFSRTVKHRDAALKALTVKTTPQVEGAWHWMSGQAVWWRPRNYWPGGTKVQVTAALDGAELASGVWGRRTYTTRFTVGPSVISTVDVKAHTITVRKNGKVARVLPVTTGRAEPKYRTRNGIKVIMDKKPIESMDAASTGTGKDDPEYYNLKVQWAMRLTWSGEYLHAAPWSVGSQGRANVSHGCTGLSTANAKWLYDFSKIGDVVIYQNSPRPLEFGNGYTAWEMSWERWSAGTRAVAASASPAPYASPPVSTAPPASPSPSISGAATSRLITPAVIG